MGRALYPHPQWDRLAECWEAFYPRAGLDPQEQRLLAELEAGMPEFVELLINHRPRGLHGLSLGEAPEGLGSILGNSLQG